jgi:thiamine-phosphate pyrophosphorylase
MLLTDPRVDPLPRVRRLPPGCAVALRHYGRPEREALGRTLRRLCRERRLLFLVANDARLAARLRADGLHLAEGVARQAARPLAWVRARRGVLSIAAHNPAALRRAGRLGADWATLSPVFPTASHPGAPTLGSRRFARWARRAGLPVLALGGITGETVRVLRSAAGVAAVTAV